VFYFSAMAQKGGGGMAQGPPLDPKPGGHVPCVDADARQFGGKTKLPLFKKHSHATRGANSRCSALLRICASFSLFCVLAQGTLAMQLLVVNRKIKNFMLLNSAPLPTFWIVLRHCPSPKYATGYMDFVCSHAAELQQLYVNKHEAKCTMRIVWHLQLRATVLFTTLNENLRLCSSAEVGLLLICS